MSLVLRHVAWYRVVTPASKQILQRYLHLLFFRFFGKPCNTPCSTCALDATVFSLREPVRAHPVAITYGSSLAILLVEIARHSVAIDYCELFNTSTQPVRPAALAQQQ